MTRAILFAYHQVGVRCLEVLLAQGIEISLVFTHVDDPKEVQWYPSVAERAREYGIRVVTPDSPNGDEWIETVKALQPDFLFSFYYRHVIASKILVLPRIGAFNMHGSLLPRYRGRVPINWAVLHGEHATGATLHAMTAKVDQGDIVDQQSVPILPNDTAYEVFQKVCVAAECVLHRSLPLLIEERTQYRMQDASQATTFGRRTPEDGRIVWSHSAQSIHNLIRAVAPPYPGAFFECHGQRFIIERSLCASSEASVPEHIKVRLQGIGLYVEHDKVWVRCGDGEFLRLFVDTDTCEHLAALQHKLGDFLLQGDV